MRICVPTEVKNNEYRVALTPAGVHDLAQAGHEVFVQRGAGEGSSMPDAEYEAAGATMLDDAAEVWARAELLLKVKEPIASEYGYFRNDLVLFTYLHLAADRALTERLGVFAKGGAEGVMVMVAPNGATVALKMLDGSSRATTAVALRLLERAGALVASDVSDAMSRLSLSVTGGGQDVGAIRPAF